MFISFFIWVAISLPIGQSSQTSISLRQSKTSFQRSIERQALDLVVFSDFIQKEVDVLKEIFPKLQIGFSQEEKQIIEFVTRFTYESTERTLEDQLEFQRLLGKVYPGFHRNYLLRLTAANDLHEFVKMLLKTKMVDVTDCDNWAITLCIENHNKKTLRTFIPIIFELELDLRHDMLNSGGLFRKLLNTTLNKENGYNVEFSMLKENLDLLLKTSKELSGSNFHNQIFRAIQECVINQEKWDVFKVLVSYPCIINRLRATPYSMGRIAHMIIKSKDATAEEFSMLFTRPSHFYWQDKNRLLLKAIQFNKTDIAEFLTLNGADPFGLMFADGIVPLTSALRVATMHHDLSMIRFLLNNRFRNDWIFDWLNVFRYLYVTEEIFLAYYNNQPLPPEINRYMATTLRNREYFQALVYFVPLLRCLEYFLFSMLDNYGSTSQIRDIFEIGGYSIFFSIFSTFLYLINCIHYYRGSHYAYLSLLISFWLSLHVLVI